MKKLWLCLLSALLVCAFGVAGLTEEGLEQIEEWEYAVEAPEPEIEVELMTDEMAEAEAEAMVLAEPLEDAEALDGGEQVVLASPASDFVIENGIITQYVGPGGDVVIPDGVTQIGENAFQRTNITSVTVPGSVSSIGKLAFWECKQMTSVTLMYGVRRIEYGAFSSCDSLCSVSLPDSLYFIGQAAFFQCKSLTSIHIPDSVRTLGWYAFSECTSLSTVNIPRSETSIRREVFSKCAITSIDIPDNITQMGEWSFYACPLSSVVIPSSVTFIDSGTFESTAITSVSIPDSVTKIGGDAFDNCQNLTSITLPEGLTEIGVRVLSNCDRLTDINLPNSLSTIGILSFSGSDGFKTLTIPNSVTKIDRQAFFACKGLETITIPASVTEIGAEAFAQCTNLREIIIEGSNVNIVEADQYTPEGYSSTFYYNPAFYHMGPNFVIVCQPNSTAEAFAVKYGFAYRYPGGQTVYPSNQGSNQNAAGVGKPNRVSIAEGKTFTVNLGETAQLNAVLEPSAAQATLTWKSSKPAVCYVNENGAIAGVKEGKAKITVTTNNKKKATITVQVVDPYKPTGISIAQGKTYTINLGETAQLNAALAPATARATLTWKSGKPAVVYVNENGAIQGVKEGKAKITVTTHNKKKATITVQVVDPYKPSGISIAQGKTLTLKVGETAQLNATLAPASARSALTWKSSKPAICYVNESGAIAGVKKGKAKITVTTYNKKKATITINVVE